MKMRVAGGGAAVSAAQERAHDQVSALLVALGVGAIGIGVTVLTVVALPSSGPPKSVGVIPEPAERRCACGEVALPPALCREEERDEDDDLQQLKVCVEPASCRKAHMSTRDGVYCLELRPSRQD